MADTERSPEEVTRLVDQNGLVKLFANRVRARVLVTLYYAETPLTPAEIAEVAGVTQSAVHETLDPLGEFDITERVGETDDGEDRPRYRLDESDELVAEIRAVAELATERFYDEEG